ncbi:MAG: ABC transporter substrate-binding protein [Spirochaetaceae bacterium]
MKSFLKLVGVAFLAASGLLFANGQQEETISVTELTMMVNFGADETVTGVISDVIEEFNASQEGIVVELIPPAGEYEQVMKTKMAANRLPDLFTTHGWSVARYSEYLEILDNESWTNKISPAIKPVITDKDDHIYVLPLDVDLSGIAYNKEVIDNAGVDIDNIKTWEDLFDAMELVKASGVTPVHIGGKDNWTIGNFFDWAAPSVYVTDKNNSSATELVSGTFDTAKWNIVAGFMKRMNDNEYLNVDKLTSTWNDTQMAFANGESAFEFFGNYVITGAKGYNPDAEFGFFPVPAYYEGDKPTFITGEKTAVGIWKDSSNIEAAKVFLDYLATPAISSRIATSNGIPAGLTDASSDMGDLTVYADKYSHIAGYPFFDRAYLPSGMWDTMCITGAGILANAMSLEEASAKMLEDFNRLYK